MKKNTKKYNFDVVFEDNHLIAVSKKSGVLCQGDKTGDKPLVDEVKEFLKEKYNKPGNVFAGLIHRLDRPVSGLVILAKTSKALTRMNEQFKTRAVQKTYWAIVKDKPLAESGTLNHYLLKNQKQNKSKAFKKATEGALQAELSYKIIKKLSTHYLLEVSPKTGRHHQIRVQLASMSCPIKGDLKYGSKRSNPDGSISLHARQLTFTHPVSKEEMTLVAPVPSTPIWQACKK